MTVIGIDPGLSGGVAVINPETSYALAMPVIDGRPDLNRLGDLYREERPDVIAVEECSIRPGESGRSALTIGRNWGLIVGHAMAFGYPLEIVTPQKWKAALGISKPKRGKDEPKESPKETKERSIALALRLFPDVDLKATPKCRSYSDGLAEALLIAEWCRRLRR